MSILGQVRRWGLLLGLGLAAGGAGADLAASTYLSPPWRADTWAGYTGVGTADGPAAGAMFNEPAGVAFDAAGNLYIADTLNSTIRQLTPGGTVSTIAGTPGLAGIADGVGEAALFNQPFGLAAAGDGTLYVADTQNHLIRRISAAGVVSTLAGTAGQAGSTNGTGATARFNQPTGVALDAAAGLLYVADTANHTIRQLVIATGEVTTLVGAAVLNGSTLDGTGAAARFDAPAALALSADGAVLYVAELAGHTLRRVTVATGMVTTLAGTAGVAGADDGTGGSARFDQPKGLALDGAGNLFVTDANGCLLRRVRLSDALVETIAGGYLQAAGVDGVGAAARFNQPAGIAYDAAVGGRLVVADALNAQLREVDLATATVGTLAGPPVSRGATDGAGLSARFRTPHHLARDAAGNLYVADEGNHTLRKIAPDGQVTTLAGLAGEAGTVDGAGGAARFNQPVGVAVTPNGASIYVSEDGGHVIRHVTAAGEVTTLAGAAGQAGSADGTGGAAHFNQPAGLALDGAGNLYVADLGNHTVRKITPAGEVSTFAGTAGLTGSADGQGGAARFHNPTGLAFDPAGRLYVADSLNQTIRRITAAGDVSTFAGAASDTGSTDADTPGAARFFFPYAVAVDAAGRVYVAELANHTIRRIDATGLVRTLAGTAGPPGGLDGLASAARFNAPQGLAVAEDGSAVYVGDTENSAIRVLTLAPVPEITSPATAAGAVGEVFGGYTITATRSPLLFGASGLPPGLAVDDETGVISGQPLAAGTFEAVLSAENVGGTGTLTVTFTIAKGAASIELANLAQPYDGSAKTPSATTAPAGLPVVFTYDGSATVPSAFGTYALVATINHANYQGSAAATFQITEPVGWSISTLATPGLLNPKGLAVAADGALYIADAGQHAIYKRTPAGVVTVFAGQPGTAGYAEGTGGAALFNGPTGLAFDAAGNLYVADTDNHLIRRITPAGVVSLVAGDVINGAGAFDGTGADAAFFAPRGLAIGPDGALYVADSGNLSVRRVTLPGALVTTLAAGQFDQPVGIAAGSDGTLWVSDAGANNLKAISPEGSVSLLAGSSFDPFGGSSDGTGSNAQFHSPEGLALSTEGLLYVADTFNSTLRQVTAAGVVTTIAGLAGDLGTTDGAGDVARFGGPTALALAADGTLYVADTDNGLIRRASPPLTVPVLAALPAVTLTQGVVLQDYAFSASGAPTHYAATGLPPGLSLDANTGAVSGTPLASGVYAVSISLTNALTTVQTDVELTVDAPTWEAWLAVHFTPGELADTLVSGRSADPDGDGVANLWEYLQDRDPFVVDNAPPAPQVIGGRVALAYDVLRTVSGWTITAEYSADLQTWQRGPGFTETLGTEILDARRQRTTVSLPASLTPGEPAFLRLTVEQNP